MDDSRPIQSISFKGEEGASFNVGRMYVTAIRPYMDMGIPFLAVYKDGEICARILVEQVEGIYY
jgi:hypothetical protein